MQADWDEIPVAREAAVELEVQVELETLSEPAEEGEVGDLIGAWVKVGGPFWVSTLASATWLEEAAGPMFVFAPWLAHFRSLRCL